MNVVPDRFPDRPVAAPGAMPRWRSSRRLSIGVIAIVCCALAAASIEQHLVSWNSYSHFAQTRAFVSGTPRIDPYRHTTGDRAFYQGHYYSDKAPGLAFLMVPVYRAARATRIVAPGGLGMMHMLVLFACVLPLAVMLLLVRRLIERTDAGKGTVVALMLGFGTLLLPFSTILFSHVLSATLGFAAFCLLWDQRERGGTGLLPVTAAGVLGGYAITTEYPLALLVVLLGLFAAWRPSPVRPLMAYATGVVVGLIPLGLYDWWAFGSPLHLSYSYVAANSSGVLGLGAPSAWNAVKLLVAGRGLLVVTPVIAAAIAGIVVLWREGRRVEALVPMVVGAAYLLYNCAYYLPFGGAVPGPRFLITTLPFFAVPLAAAYRRAPLATLALALISAGTMITATITVPVLSLAWSTSTWWHRLEVGWFSTHGSTLALFAGFAVLAVLAGVRSTSRFSVTSRDLKLTVLAVAGWYAVQHALPPLVARNGGGGHPWALLALLAIGVAAITAILSIGRGAHLSTLPALPLAALILRRLDHPTILLCAAAISGALAVTLWRRTPGGDGGRSVGARGWNQSPISQQAGPGP